MGYSRQPYIIIQISGTFGLKRKITFLGDYNRKETWYQRGYLVFWRAGSYGGKRGGGGGGGGGGVVLFLGWGFFRKERRLIQT